jgi:hypothetical protein
LKTIEHPRSASHSISSATSISVPFGEDHARRPMGILGPPYAVRGKLMARRTVGGGSRWSYGSEVVCATTAPDRAGTHRELRLLAEATASRHRSRHPAGRTTTRPTTLLKAGVAVRFLPGRDHRLTASFNLSSGASRAQTPVASQRRPALE